MEISALRINRTVAQEIARELQFACRQLEAGEWRRILLSSLAHASRETLSTKGRQIGNLGRAVKAIGSRYLREGVVHAAKEDIERARLLVSGLPSRIRAQIEAFMRLTRQQQTDHVVNMMLTWIIFWASAGGADLEGGLPDADLAFGVGNHRNPFSHSLLLGLGCEITMRMGVEIFEQIYGRLPNPHLRAWDSAQRFLQTHKNASVGAMWAGIGAHFLKDASLLAEATKPYTGLPSSVPMDVHQALFAANGAACEAVAFARDQE